MRFIPFSLLVILIQNCSDKSEIYVTANEIDGITKRVVNLTNKTTVDSLFNRQKQLAKVIVYYYNDTTKLKNVSYYKNNTLDSTSTDFYENGKIKSKKFYFLGTECFERTNYFETGELSQYIFLSSDQRKLYVRVYDGSGNCTSIRGLPFFESFMYTNGDQVFSEKDTVTTLFFAPAPPDCVVRLYTLHDREEVNNIQPLNQDQRFTFRVRIYPLEKGQYEWEVKMKMFDLSGRTVFVSDTTVLNYQVK